MKKKKNSQNKTVYNPTLSHSCWYYFTYRGEKWNTNRPTGECDSSFLFQQISNWYVESFFFPLGIEIYKSNSQAGSSWLYIYPEGIRHLLNYVKDAYENPTIYITENGKNRANSPHAFMVTAVKKLWFTDLLVFVLLGVDDVSSSSLEEALNDPIREQYYKDIFHNVLKSIKWVCAFQIHVLASFFK